MPVCKNTADCGSIIVISLPGLLTIRQPSFNALTSLFKKLLGPVADEAFLREDLFTLAA
jgi:hypothetical protein